jgi:UDP-3-O-[3-hydroxymyristoyl] glucosamine N-acyltransferase
MNSIKEKKYTLQELADLTSAKLVGDPEYVIDGVNDLKGASPQDASFLANPRYLQAMKKSNAGVICVDKQTPLWDERNYLITDNPSQTFQQIVDLLFPARQSPSGFLGLHATAVIHPTVKLGENVTVGPHAVIDEKAIIGNNTFIGSGSYIGPETRIGADCLIHPRVVIREKCVVGNRVIIQPGAVIGSCGFGYLTDKQGKHTKLNQVGSVTIEDEVEIGANTTIDRARFSNTVVGSGSKLDNLVQLGHGVKLGPNNMIVSQTGIAGSTTTGRSVTLAGHVAVAGHIHLSDFVMVAGKSGVSKSLPAGKYGGIPAIPLEEYNRSHVFLRRIETYVQQVQELEKRLQLLESGI